MTTPIPPFSTYQECREEMLKLAAEVENSTDPDDFNSAANRLADLVSAILKDEKYAEEKGVYDECSGWSFVNIQTSSTPHRLSIKTEDESAIYPIDVSFVLSSDTREVKIEFGKDAEAGRGTARLMTIART